MWIARGCTNTWTDEPDEFKWISSNISKKLSGGWCLTRLPWLSGEPWHHLLLDILISSWLAYIGWWELHHRQWYFSTQLSMRPSAKAHYSIKAISPYKTSYDLIYQRNLYRTQNLSVFWSLPWFKWSSTLCPLWLFPTGNLPGQKVCKFQL